MSAVGEVPLWVQLVSKALGECLAARNEKYGVERQAVRETLIAIDDEIRALWARPCSRDRFQEDFLKIICKLNVVVMNALDNDSDTYCYFTSALRKSSSIYSCDSDAVSLIQRTYETDLKRKSKDMDLLKIMRRVCLADVYFRHAYFLYNEEAEEQHRMEREQRDLQLRLQRRAYLNKIQAVESELESASLLPVDTAQEAVQSNQEQEQEESGHEVEEPTSDSDEPATGSTGQPLAAARQAAPNRSDCAVNCF